MLFFVLIFFLNPIELSGNNFSDSRKFCRRLSIPFAKILGPWSNANRFNVLGTYVKIEWCQTAIHRENIPLRERVYLHLPGCIRHRNRSDAALPISNDDQDFRYSIATNSAFCTEEFFFRHLQCKIGSSTTYNIQICNIVKI